MSALGTEQCFEALNEWKAHTGKVGLALKERAEDVVAALFSEARQESATIRVGSLNGKAGSSLSIEVVREDAKDPWAVHNPQEGRPSRSGIFDLIMASKNLTFAQAVDWGCNFLGWARPQFTRSFSVPRTKGGKAFGLASPRTLSDNAKRLLEHPEAMAYLTGEKGGLTLATIKQFHLGLYSQENSSAENKYQDALTYPELDSEGQPRSRFLRSRIPGVTVKQ